MRIFNHFTKEITGFFVGLVFALFLLFVYASQVQAETSYRQITFDERKIVRLEGPIGDYETRTAYFKLKEYAENTENQPIVINIDSYGGSVDAMMAIIQAIEDNRARGNLTYCFVDRKAMSAALIIFAACDYRYAAPD